MKIKRWTKFAALVAATLVSGSVFAEKTLSVNLATEDSHIAGDLKLATPSKTVTAGIYQTGCWISMACQKNWGANTGYQNRKLWDSETGLETNVTVNLPVLVQGLNATNTPVLAAIDTNTGTTNSYDMMETLAKSGGATWQVDFANVAEFASEYKVIVYSSGTRAATGSYTIGTETFTTPGGTAAHDTFVNCSAGDSSIVESGEHYMVFGATTPLTSSSFSLVVTGGNTPVNGIQIVQVAAPLAMPTGVSTSAVTGSSFALSWDDMSASDYEVVVSTNSDLNVTGDHVPSGDVVVSGLGATVSNLSAATTYYYGVLATYAGGNSGYTQGSVLTSAALADPTNVQATDIDSRMFTVTWNSVTGATGYNVKVSTASDLSSPVFTGSTTTETTILATGLTKNTAYYYGVQAFNGDGDVSFFIIEQQTTATEIVYTTPIGAGTVWNNAANWDANGIPSGKTTTGSDVRIRNDVTMDYDPAIDGLTSVDLHIGGDFRIGIWQSGILNVKSGTVTAEGLGGAGNISGMGCPGALNISGDAAVTFYRLVKLGFYNANSDVDVSVADNGTLEFSPSPTDATSTSTVILGESGATGVISISGNGAVTASTDTAMTFGANSYISIDTVDTASFTWTGKTSTDFEAMATAGTLRANGLVVTDFSSTFNVVGDTVTLKAPAAAGCESPAVALTLTTADEGETAEGAPGEIKKLLKKVWTAGATATSSITFNTVELGFEAGIDAAQLRVLKGTPVSRAAITWEIDATVVYPTDVTTGTDTVTFAGVDFEQDKLYTLGTLDSTLTPAVGINVVQEGTTISWTIESQAGVEKYIVTDAAGNEYVVEAKGGQTEYHVTVKVEGEATLTVVDYSGYSQTFLPADGNIIKVVYDLVEGWNLIAIAGANADTDELGTLWGWNGDSYEMEEAPEAGQAVWVYSAYDVQVIVQAEKAQAELELTAGWNMVGPTVNMSVPAEAHTVYGWNDTYQTIANDGTLLQGVGYWIFCDK